MNRFSSINQVSAEHAFLFYKCTLLYTCSAGRGDVHWGAHAIYLKIGVWVRCRAPQGKRLIESLCRSPLTVASLTQAETSCKMWSSGAGTLEFSCKMHSSLAENIPCSCRRAGSLDAMFRHKEVETHYYNCKALINTYLRSFIPPPGAEILEILYTTPQTLSHGLHDSRYILSNEKTWVIHLR